MKKSHSRAISRRSGDLADDVCLQLFDAILRLQREGVNHQHVIIWRVFHDRRINRAVGVDRHGEVRLHLAEGFADVGDVQSVLRGS